MIRRVAPTGWWLRLALLTLVLPSPAWARPLDAPEIIERRVPSAQLRTLFPAGRALATVPRAEFDRLKAQLADRSRTTVAWPSRSIRAWHTIRWSDGVLLGRTALTVEVDPGTVDLVPLRPWSPAILGVEGGRLGALDDGTTVVQPSRTGRSTITLDWALSPDPHSGRFDLGLPQLQPSRMDLSLPAELTPSWAPIGPGPAGAIREAPQGHRIWTFEGVGGALSLRLAPSSRSAGAAGTPGAWVRGDARIELGESGGRFRAQWLVETNAAGSQPDELRFRLAPGLTLTAVEGDGLGTPRTEPDGDSTLVRLPLRASAAQSRRVQINGVVRAPLLGSWTIPACTVEGSPWLGGRTTVVVGPERSVAEVEALGAWRVPASNLAGTDAPRSTVLAFDGFGTGPVGRLRFDAIRTGGAVEIRGQVWPDTGRLRLDAQLLVRFDGTPQPLAIELPDEWIADGVEVETPDRVVSGRYRVEPRSGRAQRVIVSPPQTGGSNGSLTIRLGASRLFGGPPGSAVTAMPRLVVRGLRVVDDAWCVRSTGDRWIRPVTATGIAWLDSERFELPRAIEARSTSPVDSTIATAWRWLGSGGGLDLDLTPAPHPPVADCWVVVDLTGPEAAVDWYLRLESRDDPMDSVTVRGFGGSDPGTYRWRLLGLEEPIQEGIAVTRPGGSDEASTPWEFTFPRSVPPARPVLLHARRVLPWPGEGSVPLPTVPARSLARGTVLVRTEPPRIARLESFQTWATDPSTAQRDLDRVLESFGLEPLTESPSALAQGRHYGSDARRLSLTTEVHETSGGTGLVEEAMLSGEGDELDRGIRHLRLRLRRGSEPVLRIGLPAGATILRARLDGQPRTPERADGALPFEFALPHGTADALRCELTLDYQLPAVAPSGDRAVSEPLPQFSWPCLATLIERPDGTGAAWEPTRSVDDRAAPLSLGSGPTVASDPLAVTSVPASRSATLLAQLEGRARGLGDLGPTLGTALQRLDGGSVPLVVDRLALLAIGVGPGTPLRSMPAGDDVPPGLGPLEQAGLVFLPGSGIVIVSAHCGVKDDPSPFRPGRLGIDAGWGDAARLALLHGNDSLDRLESIPRWVGEVPGGEDRSTGRLTALGVPDRAWWFVQGAPGESLRWHRSRSLVDATTVLLTGLVGALGWFGARAVRGRGIRTLAMLGALGVTWIAGTDASPVALGVIGGVLACAGVWVGRRGAMPTAPPRRRFRPWFTGMLVGILSVGGAIGPARQPRAQEARPLPGSRPTEAILAAVSTDDPEAPVVILEADLRRLRNLVALRDLPAISSIVLARSARHSVATEDDTLAIESRFELEASGSGMSWAVPLGDAFDIRVAVNGRRVSYRFDADRGFAAIELPGPGIAQVTVWRRVPVRVGNPVRVPINAVANAAVTILPTSGLRLHEIRGRVVGSATGPTAELGPLDELILGPADAVQAVAGRVSGLLQWYPEPAGDRVLVRLIGGLDMRRPLRFQVERGLFARPIGSGDAVELSWEGPREAPVLVITPGQAALDDGSLEFELWRPGPDDPAPEPAGRILPRLVPLDGAAFGGVVNLWNSDPARRQIVSSMALEPGADAGEDQEPARLLGAFVWEATPGPTVWLQPQPATITVSQQVELELEPGRIVVDLTAECQLPAAWFTTLQLELPSAVDVDQVTADGLRGWSQDPEGRLQLRVQADLSGMAPLRIRIRGHRDVPGTPLDPGATTNRVPVIWPLWSGVEVATGNLLIQSPTGVTFRLERPESLPLPVSSPTASAPDEPLSRATLAVGTTAPRLDLIWRDETPRADVSIANLLVTDPDRLEWRALVRYDLRNGPTRSLRLELPTSWADGIQIDAGDAKFVSFLRSAGSRTILNLSFTNPMLGRREVWLTAQHARLEGALPYPDLVPLGRGRVQTTLLAWSNGTGQALSVEGSAVQEVDRSRFQSVNLALPQGLEHRFFQVARVGWKLALDDPTGQTTPESRRSVRGLNSAQVDLVRASDGSLVGTAEYPLAPGTATSLPIRLGAGCELLEALVDGRPARVLRDPVTRICQIPISTSGAARVVLTWRQTAATESQIPVPMGQVVETLVRTFAPAGARATAIAPLQPSPAVRYWQTRLAFTADRIAGDVERFDRASSNQRQRLLESATGFLLDLRSARRAPDAAATSTGFDTLNQRAADAFQLAGLADLWGEAEVAVGETAPADSGGPIARPAIDPAPRLRRIGLASYWEGRSDGDQPLVLRWEEPASAGGRAVVGTRSGDSGRAELGLIALVLAAVVLPGFVLPAAIGLGLLAGGIVLVALSPWCLLSYAVALIAGYGLPPAGLRSATGR